MATSDNTQSSISDRLAQLRVTVQQVHAEADEIQTDLLRIVAHDADCLDMAVDLRRQIVNALELLREAEDALTMEPYHDRVEKASRQEVAHG